MIKFETFACMAIYINCPALKKKKDNRAKFKLKDIIVLKIIKIVEFFNYKLTV